MSKPEKESVKPFEYKLALPLASRGRTPLKDVDTMKIDVQCSAPKHCAAQHYVPGEASRDELVSWLKTGAGLAIEDWVNSWWGKEESAFMRARRQEMELCFREHFKSFEAECWALGIDPEAFFKRLAGDDDD